jgi:hypothetical protein
MATLTSPSAIGCRIVQGKDKRWTLHRIEDISDEGKVLGTYQGRREANKARWKNCLCT